MTDCAELCEEAAANFNNHVDESDIAAAEFFDAIVQFNKKVAL